MNLRTLLLPMAAALFLLLASCGGDDPAGNNNESAAVTQPLNTSEAQTVPAPAGVHAVSIDGQTLTLPQGLTIERWVSGRGALRMMALSGDGYLLVTEKDSGNVLAFNPIDNQPAPVPVIQGLATPSGIAYHEGAIWVAEETGVSRYAYLGQGRTGERETIVSGIPAGGHSTRTIGFGPDGKLYVAVGSSCNACTEQDERRAAISRYDPDGSGGEVIARGLRNTVGFVWHPRTGELWGVDNGRDMLGDDLPPEEVNVIEAGKHYGWPLCYGSRIADPENGRPDFCPSTEPPRVEMQAHSAPLGLRFLDDPAWPQAWQENLFIAFHGSWNRSVPTGYKVVRVDASGAVNDFITGWADAAGTVWGRPVDILISGGVMYITDDFSGSIYRVRVEAAPAA